MTATLFSLGPVEALFLVAIGVVTGIISTIAGGASIVSYPGLVFMGLTPIVANATNFIAVAPASFAAVWVDRRRLPAVTGDVARVFLASLLGAVGGGLALVATGEALYRAIVPALLGFATLLYWAAPAVQQRFARDGGERYPLWLIACFALAAAYSGYFGTGYGVILLALLRLAGVADFVRANMLKNMIASVASVGTIGFFVSMTKLVSWPHAAFIIVGNIVGGVVGAWLVHVLPGEAVRRAIILVGCVVTAVFAWRYWLAG